MSDAVIQGEKIQLRAFRLSDIEPMWVGVNDPENKRMTGTHATSTQADIEDYVKHQILADDPSITSFIIALSDDLRPLGEVAITEIDTDNHCANIRIALFSQMDFGQGYGTEAMRLMVDYGFRELNLHRIELDVYPFNPRAMHVYEKIGFKREGVLRDALFFDGEYHDEIIMGILKHEWYD